VSLAGAPPPLSGRAPARRAWRGAGAAAAAAALDASGDVPADDASPDDDDTDINDDADPGMGDDANAAVETGSDIESISDADGVDDASTTRARTESATTSGGADSFAAAGSDVDADADASAASSSDAPLTYGSAVHGGGRFAAKPPRAPVPAGVPQQPRARVRAEMQEESEEEAAAAAAAAAAADRTRAASPVSVSRSLGRFAAKVRGLFFRSSSPRSPSQSGLRSPSSMSSTRDEGAGVTVRVEPAPVAAYGEPLSPPPLPVRGRASLRASGGHPPLTPEEAEAEAEAIADYYASNRGVPPPLPLTPGAADAAMAAAAAEAGTDLAITTDYGGDGKEGEEQTCRQKVCKCSRKRAIIITLVVILLIILIVGIVLWQILILTTINIGDVRMSLDSACDAGTIVVSLSAKVNNPSYFGVGLGATTLHLFKNSSLGPIVRDTGSGDGPTIESDELVDGKEKAPMVVIDIPDIALPKGDKVLALPLLRIAIDNENALLTTVRHAIRRLEIPSMEYKIKLPLRVWFGAIDIPVSFPLTGSIGPGSTLPEIPGGGGFMSGSLQVDDGNGGTTTLDRGILRGYSLNNILSFVGKLFSNVKIGFLSHTQRRPDAAVQIKATTWGLSPNANISVAIPSMTFEVQAVLPSETPLPPPASGGTTQPGGDGTLTPEPGAETPRPGDGTPSSPDTVGEVLLARAQQLARNEDYDGEYKYYEEMRGPLVTTVLGLSIEGFTYGTLNEAEPETARTAISLWLKSESLDGIQRLLSDVFYNRDSTLRITGSGAPIIAAAAATTTGAAPADGTAGPASGMSAVAPRTDRGGFAAAATATEAQPGSCYLQHLVDRVALHLDVPTDEAGTPLVEIHSVDFMQAPPITPAPAAAFTTAAAAAGHSMSTLAADPSAGASAAASTPVLSRGTELFTLTRQDLHSRSALGKLLSQLSRSAAAPAPSVSQAAAAAVTALAADAGTRTVTPLASALEEWAGPRGALLDLQTSTGDIAAAAALVTAPTSDAPEATNPAVLARNLALRSTTFAPIASASKGYLHGALRANFSLNSPLVPRATLPALGVLLETFGAAASAPSSPASADGSTPARGALGGLFFPQLAFSRKTTWYAPTVEAAWVQDWDESLQFAVDLFTGGSERAGFRVRSADVTDGAGNTVADLVSLAALEGSKLVGQLTESLTDDIEVLSVSTRGGLSIDIEVPVNSPMDLGISDVEFDLGINIPSGYVSQQNYTAEAAMSGLDRFFFSLDAADAAVNGGSGGANMATLSAAPLSVGSTFTPLSAAPADSARAVAALTALAAADHTAATHHHPLTAAEALLTVMPPASRAAVAAALATGGAPATTAAAAFTPSPDALAALPEQRALGRAARTASAAAAAPSPADAAARGRFRTAQGARARAPGPQHTQHLPQSRDGFRAQQAVSHTTAAAAVSPAAAAATTTAPLSVAAALPVATLELDPRADILPSAEELSISVGGNGAGFSPLLAAALRNVSLARGRNDWLARAQLMSSTSAATDFLKDFLMGEDVSVAVAAKARTPLGNVAVPNVRVDLPGRNYLGEVLRDVELWIKLRAINPFSESCMLEVMGRAMLGSFPIVGGRIQDVSFDLYMHDPVGVPFFYSPLKKPKFVSRGKLVRTRSAPNSPLAELGLAGDPKWAEQEGAEEVQLSLQLRDFEVCTRMSAMLFRPTLMVDVMNINAAVTVGSQGFNATFGVTNLILPMPLSL
jgi:hypothetical protein